MSDWIGGGRHDAAFDSGWRRNDASDWRRPRGSRACRQLEEDLENKFNGSDLTVDDGAQLAAAAAKDGWRGYQSRRHTLVAVGKGPSATKRFDLGVEFAVAARANLARGPMVVGCYSAVVLDCGEKGGAVRG
ncbi:hypothetical protein E2562_018095 [Oryza meyeriana var. granulata]|uniref:Uncharacterized protein n=1 Tax=Oryza meyeriana var. granulata TaxID=110450 RepID=A0A6G1CR33_9ORYZ|nr:hypothetical protein E2562_018095 [Oryza meyeriana var. granulata]